MTKQQLEKIVGRPLTDEEFVKVANERGERADLTPQPKPYALSPADSKTAYAMSGQEASWGATPEARAQTDAIHRDYALGASYPPGTVMTPNGSYAPGAAPPATPPGDYMVSSKHPLDPTYRYVVPAPSTPVYTRDAGSGVQAPYKTPETVKSPPAFVTKEAKVQQAPFVSPFWQSEAEVDAAPEVDRSRGLYAYNAKGEQQVTEDGPIDSKTVTIGEGLSSKPTPGQPGMGAVLVKQKASGKK